MTAAAARYGASLFELAAEERLDERILQELDCAAGCIAAEPAYVRLLSAPNIPRRERRATSPKEPIRFLEPLHVSSALQLLHHLK